MQTVTLLIDNHGRNTLTGEHLRDTVLITVDDTTHPCVQCPHGSGVHMGACRVFCCPCSEYRPLFIKDYSNDAWVLQRGLP